MTSNNSLFQNAVTEADGVSVNVGYLSLFWLLRLDIALSVAVMFVGLWQQYADAEHAYPFDGVAAALGSIWGTFSVALGALGLFLMGDRRPQVPSTSVSVSKTTVP